MNPVDLLSSRLTQISIRIYIYILWQFVTNVLVPQIAQLLELLLQVEDELDMCVLEQAWWCCCRVPLQSAASGC